MIWSDYCHFNFLIGQKWQCIFQINQNYYDSTDFLLHYKFDNFRFQSTSLATFEWIIVVLFINDRCTVWVWRPESKVSAKVPQDCILSHDQPGLTPLATERPVASMQCPRFVRYIHHSYDNNNLHQSLCWVQCMRTKWNWRWILIMLIIP